MQNEFSKDHIQKIESLKNIRQDKDKSKDNSKESKEKENPKETKEKENSKDLKEKEVKPTVPEKKPPSVPNQSLVNNNSKRRE